MKIAVCSSFNRELYAEYGKKFLASYASFWPENIDLYVYTEDGIPEWPGNSGPTIHFRDLNDQQEYADFMAEAQDADDYRFCARRFAHKVFAITDPDRPEVDWWIWLDADTETFAPIDEDWLRRICLEPYTAAWLGRAGMHSECGWVAYNTGRGFGPAMEFLERFREVYTTGELYDHAEWHDSYIFDVVRQEMETDGHKFLNLSRNAAGLHVWPDTILGERMRHYKGPLRKKGIHCEMPAGYWSKSEK